MAKHQAEEQRRMHYMRPEEYGSSCSEIAGGVLKVSAPGQLPWNEKQVTNLKAKLVVQSRASSFPQLSLDAAADDLCVVMQQAYAEDTSKMFVCAVNATP